MKTFSILTATLLCLVPSLAIGQAYCSLRDPVSAIQAAFPELDHYRSFVREIHPQDRNAILDSLPFTIHQNELGTHTLYAAFAADDSLLGIVHVRTERGRWGLTEIAWTFDSELRVIEMNFQRSRDSSRELVESKAFQDQIRGKNFDELRAMLDEEGTHLNGELIQVTPGAEDLAIRVIQSALKTISVTETVWELKLQGLGISAKAS
jgi:hypothetical protein